MIDKNKLKTSCSCRYFPSSFFFTEVLFFFFFFLRGNRNRENLSALMGLPRWLIQCSCSTKLSILPCHRWHVLEFGLSNLLCSWTRWDEWYLNKSGACRVWQWAIEPQAAFLHVSLASPLFDFASESFCDVKEKDFTVPFSLNLYSGMSNAYWFE